MKKLTITGNFTVGRLHNIIKMINRLHETYPINIEFINVSSSLENAKGLADSMVASGKRFNLDFIGDIDASLMLIAGVEYKNGNVTFGPNHNLKSKYHLRNSIFISSMESITGWDLEPFRDEMEEHQCLSIYDDSGVDNFHDCHDVFDALEAYRRINSEEDSFRVHAQPKSTPSVFSFFKNLFK